MVSAIISRLVILVFGTLYPAYASYKAVRTKNVKEYVKWMMYWIVFALFCSVETFSDVFLSWLPFYYELKIVFVLWMLSPMTQGSSFLFKKFVHPQLARREKEIDEMIEQASKQGYTTLVTIGTKGLQAVMKTAIMGQSKLVDHLRRSYSTSDLSNDGHNLVPRHEAMDEGGEDELDNRLIEDNAELARRSKVPPPKTRGSSSALSLSSVKEEEGEDGEHVITETYTVPPSTRRHYSMREGNKADTRQLRCKSLPPSSERFTKPLISGSSVEAKTQFFTKFQSLEKHEKESQPGAINLNPIESKKYLLRRSLSQGSSSRSLTSFTGSVEARKEKLTRALSEGREIGKIANLPLTPIGACLTTAQSNEQQSVMKQKQSTQEGDCAEGQNFGQARDAGDPGIKEDEDARLQRRNVPRFQSDLPVIDETISMDFAQQSLVTPAKAVPSELKLSEKGHPDSQSPKKQDDSQIQSSDFVKGPKLKLMFTDDFGEDLSELIHIDFKDNSDSEEQDEHCLTPVPKDDDQDSFRFDDHTGESFAEDSGSNFCSGNQAESLDNKDMDTCSEMSDSSSLWETLSEVSVAESSDYQRESLPSVSSGDEEEASDAGPWSAPSSPAAHIRHSKFLEDWSQSQSSPSSPSVSTRGRHQDEIAQIMSRLRKQTSVPSYTSIDIIYSWPSTNRPSDSVSLNREMEKSKRSRGHGYDPFQSWSPPRSSGYASYPYLSSTLPKKGDRQVTRSSSLDLGNREYVYGRYLSQSPRSGSQSPVSYARSSSQGSETSKACKPYYSKAYQPSVYKR